MKIMHTRMRGGSSPVWLPNGKGVVSSGDYLSLSQLPDLELLYRTRPLNKIGGIPVVTKDSKTVLLSTPKGGFALFSAQNGNLLSSIDNDAPIQGRYGDCSELQLSQDERFIVDRFGGHRVRVFEIASGRLVWSKTFTNESISQLTSIDNGQRWVFQHHPYNGANYFSVWSWPFGDHADRVQPLFGPGLYSRSPIITANGRWVIEYGMRYADEYFVEIRDFETGDLRVQIPHRKNSLLTHTSLSSGGKFLCISQNSKIDIYDLDGTLKHTIHSAKLRGRIGWGHNRLDMALYSDNDLYVLTEIGEDTPIDIMLPSASFKPVTVKNEMPYRRYDSLFYDFPTPQTLPDRIPLTLSDMGQYRRTTFLPKIDIDKVNIRGSQFGGTPLIPNGQQWPTCGGCEALMQLFLQLHSADLPPEHQKLFDGLLQLFVCTTQTDGDCNSYEPFAHGNLVRVIASDDKSTQLSNPTWDTYSPVGICGWEACDDHPSTQELEDRYGEEISRNQEDQIMDLCVSGEKLLGWPNWDQNVAYPACPVCQSKMQFIFQMPSDHILPFMFGDGGTGWITQCPAHPEQMTFSWDS